MNDQRRVTSDLRVIAFLIAGVVILFKIILNGTGGISGAVSIFGGTLCFYCFVYPKSGMYVLGFFCFYLDFVKKLAVVYGQASMNTVIEVLVIQLLALACVFTGALVRLLLVDRKLKASHLLAALFTSAITIAIFSLCMKSGTTSALQSAANSGAYSGIILVIMSYFGDRQGMIRYLDYLLCLSLPWAVYGVIQYFFGFADMDWTYARTGLSPVSSVQMLGFENPRPFGFASGASGYGVLSITMAYGLWRSFNATSRRFLFIIASLILLAGLVVSMQRTILFIPFLCAILFLLYRSRIATCLAYGAAVLIFVVGILSTDFLFAHLETFDISNYSKNKWATNVVKIATWSDRLRGWERLKRSSTYTLFGKRWGQAKFSQGILGYADEDFSHDLINTILNNVGVVGLLLTLGGPCLLLRGAHRKLWAMPLGPDRDFAAFTMAVPVLFAGLSCIGGSNLGTTPINLMFWTFIACMVNTLYFVRLNQQEEIICQETSFQGIPPPELAQVRYRMRPSRNLIKSVGAAGP